MKNKSKYEVYSLGQELVISHINRYCRQRRFKSEEDVNLAIDYCKQVLENYRSEAIKKYNKCKECKHDFDKPVFSVRRRIADYVTVYERTCKLCYFKEELYKEKGLVLPEWTDGATQIY